MTMSSFAFTAKDATALIVELKEAAAALSRTDSAELDRQVEVLVEFPFDAVVTTLSVMLARELAAQPASLLLSTQADLAPATTVLRRTIGQLFLLAGHMLTVDQRPDAPLVALKAISGEVDRRQVIHGGLWALVTCSRALSQRSSL